MEVQEDNYNKFKVRYKYFSSEVIIDKKFLNNVPYDLKEEFLEYFYFVYTNVSRAKQKLSREDFTDNLNRIGMYFVYSFCPYCKKNSLKLYIQRTKPFGGGYCGFCGENSVFDKKEGAFEKVNILLDLVEENEIREKSIYDDKLKRLFDMIAELEERGTKVKKRNLSRASRVLYEQVIVLLATTLEVFLKEIYSSILNITLIKKGRTEIERFRKECKNEFTNKGKIVKRFKTLNINLDNKLNKDTLSNINTLFLKRHIIVHNNGYVDKDFISQSGLNLKFGQTISINDEEIYSYIKSIEELTDIIGDEYRKIYEEVIKEEFINGIWEIAPFAFIVRVIRCAPTYSLLHAPNFITKPDITKVFPKPISPSKEELNEINLKLDKKS